MTFDPNHLSSDAKRQLAATRWGPNTAIDVHKLGVHWYSPEYLPTGVDPLTYAALLHRGLTPPMALPVYVEPDAHERIDRWLEANYFKLHNAGLGYLGNEFNVQPKGDWDTAKLRVCLCRLTSYEILDGAFGGFLIGNFIADFSKDIFIDYAYFPEPSDIPKLYEAGLPLMWGNTTKRPLTDFDIVIWGTSYPGERVHLPLAMVKSGLPLYRWQRFDSALPYRARCPVVALAGIGASFIENMLADNPVKGVGQNAVADHVLIGEGEMMDLKYFQQFIYNREAGGTKEDFFASMTNTHHKGVYDPTRVLFEYADKVHQTRDFEGRVLSETVYEGAGHIKAIHLLDHENRVRYALAGPDNEEFADLEAINAKFQLHLAGSGDPAEFGRRYVKVGDRPSPGDRLASGMAPQGSGTQAQVAAERKAGITRVSGPAR